MLADHGSEHPYRITDTLLAELAKVRSLADGHVISAAPEMFESLDHLDKACARNAGGGLTLGAHEVVMIKSALSKARGER